MTKTAVFLSLTGAVLLAAAAGTVWLRPAPATSERYSLSSRPAIPSVEPAAAIHWYPVSVGPPALLAEGAQVSSVLQGPDGRIYYGTANPLADADIVGWVNPASRVSRWTQVPTVNPLFPADAGLSDLPAPEAASWGGVDLVVSGAQDVWYQHWGYVGGWTKSGKFVSGVYRIPGPTVTNNGWTAAISTTFSATSTIRIANATTNTVLVQRLPGTSSPVSVAMTNTAGTDPHIWLMTQSALWQMPRPGATWQKVSSVPAGDFYVALGRWGKTVWTVDANGDVDTVGTGGIVHHVKTLAGSPLDAVAAPNRGLWIAFPHHIGWWQPGRPLKLWPLPRSTYPAPANGWSVSGSSEPPDWPPAVHISEGANQSFLIGDGTWVGVARVNPSSAHHVAIKAGGKA